MTGEIDHISKSMSKHAFDRRERQRVATHNERFLPKGNQLGFGAMLEDASCDNAARVFERETAHLPATWGGALSYHRQQIESHHAAMLETDFEAAMAIPKEAHLLATKLNGGKLDILASDDAPGCKLDAQSAAAEGAAGDRGGGGQKEI